MFYIARTENLHTLTRSSLVCSNTWVHEPMSSKKQGCICKCKINKYVVGAHTTHNHAGCYSEWHG